jgi:hypothetical protein
VRVYLKENPEICQELAEKIRAGANTIAEQEKTQKRPLTPRAAMADVDVEVDAE